MVRNRYEGLQTLLKACGDEGCHFLVLCSIADEYNITHGRQLIDLVDAIHHCMHKKWLTSDYYSRADLPILEWMTDAKWSRKEVEELPVIRDNEYTEAVYFNPTTNLKHYRRRGFDTRKKSRTVAEGYVLEYRIYTATE